MAPLNFPVTMWSHNSTATYALLQQPSNWSQLPLLWWLLLYLLHWRSTGTALTETKAALMENNRSITEANTESSHKCELQWLAALMEWLIALINEGSKYRIITQMWITMDSCSLSYLHLFPTPSTFTSCNESFSSTKNSIFPSKLPSVH